MAREILFKTNAIGVKIIAIGEIKFSLLKQKTGRLSNTGANWWGNTKGLWGGVVDQCD